MPHTLKIFLLRHAHVDYASHQGPNVDAPLSATGKAQCERVCRYFKAISLDRIISSPYRRAIETATSVAESKDLSIEVKPWLREFDAAMFEYTEDNLQAYGLEADAYPAVSWQDFPSSDKLQAHQQEIYEGVSQLLKEYGLVKRGFLYDGALEKSIPILFCGHVGSILTIAGYLLNLHPMHCLHAMHVGNACVSLFIINRDEKLSSKPYRCRLRFWNQSPGKSR